MCGGSCGGSCGGLRRLPKNSMISMCGGSAVVGWVCVPIPLRRRRPKIGRACVTNWTRGRRITPPGCQP
jgi:hypothetical protein